MTYPTITPLPDAPSRSQDPDAFSSTADTFVAALPDLVTDVNAAGAYIDNKSIAVGNDFQGTYSAGTTYTTGQSVVYSDVYYLSLVDSNTGNTPDSSPSQWQEIPTSELPDQSGNSGLYLTTDGTDLSWGEAGGGGMKSMQVFTSSGTWTKPAGINLIRVRLVGGGGAGAISTSSNVTGGGAGGYAEEIIDVSAVATVSVTVGNAGASNGAAGGTSSFGAYLSATGGGGGNSGITATLGGAGGVGTGGTLNVYGGVGDTNPDRGNGGGGGGASFFGGGNGSIARGAPSSFPFAYGAGGAGVDQDWSSANTGGAAGIVIVEEYE